MLLVTACDPDESVPDAGPVRTDSGTGPEDGGADAGDGDPDAGPLEDGGTQEPTPCERTLGVCEGAARAQVDGGYEPVCTAHSYGSDYEEVESRCDGLDNDCDGVTDPAHWSQVAELRAPVTSASSLRVDGGILVAVLDAPAVEASVLRLDSRLALQGTSRVPLVQADAGSVYGEYSRLLRTARGPSLGYVERKSADGASRMYVAPLDESGAPAPLADGGTGSVLAHEQPGSGTNSRVGASADGNRLLFAWGTGTLDQEPRVVMGVITDAEGQVLAGPKELFRAVRQAGDLYVLDVLWLRNGEVSVVAQEAYSRQTTFEDLVRIHRFDSRLDPVGEETSLRTPESPQPALVEMGPDVGGPLLSPLLVMRRQATNPDRFQFQSVYDLFEGGSIPQTLVETTPWQAPGEQEVPWFNVSVGEPGLRLAWLSARYDPQSGQSSGRLWTWEEGGTPVDRTPGPQRLPLHRSSQWVLMEELGEGEQGALFMTSSESRYYLEAVRYCAP